MLTVAEIRILRGIADRGKGLSHQWALEVLDTAETLYEQRQEARELVTELVANPDVTSMDRAAATLRKWLNEALR